MIFQKTKKRRSARKKFILLMSVFFVLILASFFIFLRKISLIVLLKANSFETRQFLNISLRRHPLVFILKIFVLSQALWSAGLNYINVAFGLHLLKGLSGKAFFFLYNLFLWFFFLELDEVPAFEKVFKSEVMAVEFH